MRRRWILAAALVAIAGAIATWIAAGRDPAPGPTSESAASTGEGAGLAPHPMRLPDQGASDPPSDGNARTGAATPRADGSQRTIDVLVRDDERKPFAGLTVVAMAADATTEVVGLTDASGRVTLAIPWSEGGRVFIRRAGRETEERRIDDVHADPGPIQLFSARRESISLRIALHSRPFLPTTFSAVVAGAPVKVQMTVPDEGFVRGDYAPPLAPTPMALTFMADGYPARVIEIPDDPAGSGADLHVELDPAGPSVSIEERAPRDFISCFVIQRWDETRETWEYVSSTAAGAMRYVDGVAHVSVEGLAAGRYRVAEGIANAKSEPFVLMPGGAPARVRFDFPKAGMARGRIVVPPALATGSLRIGLWDGTRAEGTPRVTGGVTGPDFAFRLEIPGDRPVTLGAIHSLGPAYGGSGTVTIVEPRDDIELRVGEATETARIDVEAAQRDEERPAYATIRLWDPVARRVVWEHRATLDAGGFRFGGFLPGTYDVVVDDHVHAPIVLTDVALGAGATHLGRHTLRCGEQIRIRQVVPDGMNAPDAVMAIAERLDDPRVGNTQRVSTDEHIRGLLPGRHRVFFFANGPMLPPASGISQIVDVVEGEHADATIVFHAPAAPTSPK